MREMQREFTQLCCKVHVHTHCTIVCITYVYIPTYNNVPPFVHITIIVQNVKTLLRYIKNTPVMCTTYYAITVLQ